MRIYAQVQVLPPFPTTEDTVTVIYDATQGTGGLRGVAPVYAHTGVITNRSTSPFDWRHVVSRWGTDDPKVRMTSLGNDRHSLRFHIRSFYGVPETDTVRQLAFVFRNVDGTREGKGTGGTDIFYPVYSSGTFIARLFSPSASGGALFYRAGDTVRIYGASSISATLTLSEGTTQLAQITGREITFNYVVPRNASSVSRVIRFTATHSGQTQTDSLTLFVRGETPIAALPSGMRDGINLVDSTTVVLVLFAPNKDFIYVIGDFNNWQPTAQGLMNRTPDGQRYWIRLSNLTPHREYGFQYIIDGSIRITDPYVEKILDPMHDAEVIRENRYPNLMPYPTGKTTGIVGVFQTPRKAYPWRVQTFRRPAVKDLVVYEMLIRDFTNRRTFRAAMDSLQYLKRLGVNCIELMPVNEFDGNNSWGYNPSFYCAVDKYYGTEHDLRAFIDSAHALGIAVVLDVVFNHATGLCPLYQLYPASENPYFNVQARHPFNVFNDFNHEFVGTQQFMDKVLRFWTEEFRVDGFRFDLSKGFTQFNSGSNVSLWSARDTSRIRLLKRMYDEIRKYDRTSYLILEHFADNSEERELADYGFMFWGNLAFTYNEATMGWNNNSNFSWIYHRQRGWQFPHVLGYMESHDEERLMFKNIQFGNRTDTYSTRDTTTALERMKLAANFFFTIPGPKMIWQFGELGYDYSINWPSLTDRDRLTIKPTRWDYYDDPRRRALYNVYAELAKLKVQQPVFSTDNVTLSLNGALKRIALTDTSAMVLVLGNFDVLPQAIIPAFQRTGIWHEFWTRSTLTVNDVNAPLTLRPGEFRLYSTVPFPAPPRGLITNVHAHHTASNDVASVYPNPASDAVEIRFVLQNPAHVRITLYDATGKYLATIAHASMNAGEQWIVWIPQNDIPIANGLYFYRIFIDNAIAQTGTFIIMR
ncbi:MAG: alpha-amylase family glycosyl hydrolase [Bacteroidota bacterium]|nr:alpha-amylase family glycosyl hydrolase [Bacteroidota bacterium]